MASGPLSAASCYQILRRISDYDLQLLGFDKINGAINGLGVVNEGVLLQEFLEGKEYVVNDGDVIFFKFNVTAEGKKK